MWRRTRSRQPGGGRLHAAGLRRHREHRMKFRITVSTSAIADRGGARHWTLRSCVDVSCDVFAVRGSYNCTYAHTQIFTPHAPRVRHETQGRHARGGGICLMCVCCVSILGVCALLAPLSYTSYIRLSAHTHTHKKGSPNSYLSYRKMPHAQLFTLSRRLRAATPNGASGPSCHARAELPAGAARAVRCSAPFVAC